METSQKPTRRTRDETRTCIMAKADELFRQYGFGKTTVADIAQELGMSTANIYKFFPSKNAIMESSAARNVGILKESVCRAISSETKALAQIEQLVLTIFRFHKVLLRNEKQIFRLVGTAVEQNWECIRSYHEFLIQTLSKLVERGVENGEFRPTDPHETAVLLRDCLSIALHPHLRNDFNHDQSEERVIAQVHFLGKALK